MARIRSIKPDLPQDRKLAAVPRDARLMFVYGLTIADDEGLFRAELAHLKTLFPYDDDLTGEALARVSRDLLQAGVWRERWTRDGCRVIEIVNWAKHQRIDHKSKSFIASELTPIIEAPSRKPRERLARPSRLRVLSPESLSPESLKKQPLVGLKPDEVETPAVEPQEPLPSPAGGGMLVQVLASPNGSRPRKYDEIITHLSAVLADVNDGRLERLRVDEMRTLQAELVFSYWQAECGHERALLDDQRLNRLKRFLKENGGNVHELLWAVKGWSKDPTFQKMADQEGRVLDGIDNIFRNRERLERLANHCKGYREGKPHPMAGKYLEPPQGDGASQP